jgi:hypothetical protein
MSSSSRPLPAWPCSLARVSLTLTRAPSALPRWPCEGGGGWGQAPRAALRLRSVLRGVQGHQLGAKGAAPAQLRRVCACQGAVAGDKLRPAQAQARASKARARLQGAAPRAPRPPAAQLAPPVRHVSAAHGAAAVRAPPSTVSARLAVRGVPQGWALA